MKTMNFSLQTILNSFTRVKKNKSFSTASKYGILDMGVLGGIKRRILVLFFLSLPFIEFAIIFNPSVFNYLGIAQSIIFYIVFMSILMMIIVGVTWKNNKNVFSTIVSSWNNYFPDVDLRVLLSSGVTPYSDFFKRYGAVAHKELDDKSLQASLRKLFNEMQEENRDLFEMMQKANKEN